MPRPVRALLKGSGATRFVSVDTSTIDVEARSILGKSTPNLISNGTFIDNIDGWVGVNGNETLAWAEDESATDDDSGSLSGNRPAGACVLTYAPDGGPIVLGDLESISLSFKVKSAHSGIYVFGSVVFYEDETYDNYIDSVNAPHIADFVDPIIIPQNTWVEFGRGSILVPEGSTHIAVKVAAVGVDDTDPVFFDDITVGGGPRI